VSWRDVWRISAVVAHYNGYKWDYSDI
jgi:hypothetical protein